MDAIVRFSNKHKRVVVQLNRDRTRKRKRAWHRSWTKQKVAAVVGVTAETVRGDVERGLLTPCGKEIINGRRCLVFGRKEVRQYKDFKDVQYGKRRKRGR